MEKLKNNSKGVPPHRAARRDSGVGQSAGVTLK